MADSSVKKKVVRRRHGEQTRQKILEAAERVFARRGYLAARVTEIIKEAGCSTGSFYHSFDDKLEVLLLLRDRYMETGGDIADDVIIRAGDYKNLSDYLGLLVRLTVKQIDANKGFVMAANEISSEQGEIWAELRSLTFRICDDVAAQAGNFGDQITHPDPPQALRQSVQLLMMIMTSRQIRPTPVYPADEAAMTAMLVNAMMGILRPAVPVHRHGL